MNEFLCCSNAVLTSRCGSGGGGYSWGVAVLGKQDAGTCRRQRTVYVKVCGSGGDAERWEWLPGSRCKVAQRRFSTAVFLPML